MVVSVRTLSLIDVKREKGWDNGWTLNGLSSGKYSTFDSIGVLLHYFLNCTDDLVVILSIR